MTQGMHLGLTFRAPVDVHTRRFGSELIILELSVGEYFSLDELGARIWEELAQGRSLGDVVEKLAPEYDVVVDRFQDDVCALTAELVRRGLLVEQTGPKV